MESKTKDKMFMWIIYSLVIVLSLWLAGTGLIGEGCVMNRACQEIGYEEYRGDTSIPVCIKCGEYLIVTMDCEGLVYKHNCIAKPAKITGMTKSNEYITTIIEN